MAQSWLFSRFIKMAEMLAFSVRLLVVRCLVFAAVHALMRPRGKAGGIKECAGHISAVRRARVRSRGQYWLNAPERAGRRWRWLGCAAGVRGRRASVAHQRANYFFPAQGGGAVRKGGAGLRVEVCLCYSGEKTVYWFWGVGRVLCGVNVNEDGARNKERRK